MSLLNTPRHVPLTNFPLGNGCPVVIIGSGPSQDQLKDVPWRDYFSISINFAQKYYPSPMYAWQDNDFVKNSKPWLSTQRAVSLAYLPSALRGIASNQGSHMVGYFSRRRVASTLNRHTVMSIETPVFRTGILAAISASVLGYSPIVLVGFDATNTYEYANSHPIHGKINKTAQGSNSRHYEFMKQNYEKLEWVNCSYSDFAPKHDLKQVLQVLPRNGEEMRIRIKNNIASALQHKKEHKVIEEWLTRTPI